MTVISLTKLVNKSTVISFYKSCDMFSKTFWKFNPIYQKNSLSKILSLICIFDTFFYYLCPIIALYPVSAVIQQRNTVEDYTTLSQQNVPSNWMAINHPQLEINENEWTNNCFTLYIPWNTTIFNKKIDKAKLTKKITKSALILKVMLKN